MPEAMAEPNRLIFTGEGETQSELDIHKFSTEGIWDSDQDLRADEVGAGSRSRDVLEQSTYGYKN